jgi:predicted permease
MVENARVYGNWISEVRPDMKETMPTWPQTLLICVLGMASIVCGYFLSRLRDNWGPAAWAVLALLLIFATGFVVTVMLFYMRPQYGARAVPYTLVFLLGHGALVAVLCRIGVFG